MQEGIDNINLKAPILLSRNMPIALVVGVAGFLGSHLSEELLSKNIQVLGVDNFSTGKKENLQGCIKDKKFHLVDVDASSLQLDLPRLDYLFIAAGADWNLQRVLSLARDFKSRIVFVSSIELYNRQPEEDLLWFKDTEGRIAQFAKTNNLNARIVRLGSVFGPRMHFQSQDPMVKLIKAQLLGQLQGESTAMEFSSRALFVTDAVDLVVKSMLAGVTASKIFDGVGIPVKVTEIKQVLLDPIWYQDRHFIPSELPPWPTPNLARTQKELYWKPGVSLVEGLRKTLSYSKEHEIRLPPEPATRPKKEWQENLEGFLSKEDQKPLEKKTIWQKFNFPQIKRLTILVFLGWLLIFYALIFPFISLGFGILTFQQSLTLALNHLLLGEFDQGLHQVKRAKNKASQFHELASSMELIERLGFGQIFWEKLDGLANFSQKVTLGSEYAILGTQTLIESLKVLSQGGDDPQKYFQEATGTLQAADNLITLAQLQILPKPFQNLKENLEKDSQFIKRAYLLAKFLPKVVEENKSYLFLWQDQNELRPSGGKIKVLAQVDFEKGVLKRIQAFSVEEIDKKLKLEADPPKELKTDLGLASWGLGEANWEVDFPTSAHQVALFYKQAQGIKVDGVVALDSLAIKRINGKELSETSDNLKALLDKILFVPQKLPQIISTLDQLRQEKHLLIFLAEPKLLSFLISANLAGSMPKVKGDFLLVVEASLDGQALKLERKYQLETNISQKGEIAQKLQIIYQNKSNTLSKHKARLKIYLPLGTKLNKISLDNVDLTANAGHFADYGKMGLSFPLELEKKEQALVVDYQIPNKLEFVGGIASYQIDIIKQPGILQDPLEWRLNLPANFQSSQKVILTDLSQDRHFEINLTKK